MRRYLVNFFDTMIVTTQPQIYADYRWLFFFFIFKLICVHLCKPARYASKQKWKPIQECHLVMQRDPCQCFSKLWQAGLLLLN